MKKYIHYGANEFDKEKLCNIYKEETGDKPNGLWGSPLSSEYGWKEWCLWQEFRTERLKESFKFRIDKKAKILRVRREEDILSFVIKDPYNRREPLDGCKTCRFFDQLDLKRIYKTFDGMEYIDSDWRLYSGMFNSWDVDSIVIWNPNVILPIKP